jgi:hypothetical protein
MEKFNDSEFEMAVDEIKEAYNNKLTGVSMLTLSSVGVYLQDDGAARRGCWGCHTVAYS